MTEQYSRHVPFDLGIFQIAMASPERAEGLRYSPEENRDDFLR